MTDQLANNSLNLASHKPVMTQSTGNQFAFVFPGQGSQSVGMLAELAQVYPQVVARFECASAVLDYDLWKLAQSGPVSKLAETEITQPLMLTADIAIWDIWESESTIKSDAASPSILAGHSLGEYSALVASGAVTFEEALTSVVNRARAMTAAVPDGQGGMLAVIGLDAHVLEIICQQVSDAKGVMVNCVNYNAPGQIVVGGDKSAIEEVEKLAKEAGAKRLLPVAMSVPSHSPMMKPAADRLAEHLETVTLKEPKIPVMNNARLSIEHDVNQIKQALIEQIYLPVNWVQLITKIKQMGINTIIECGPGRVLSGLHKRIDKSLILHNLSTVDGLQSAMSGVCDEAIKS